MKKTILLLLGLFVAGIAAYSIPKESKMDVIHLQKILKIYHLAEQPAVIVSEFTKEDFSPGIATQYDFIKNYIEAPAERFAIVNRAHPFYLARNNIAINKNLNKKDRPLRRL